MTKNKLLNALTLFKTSAREISDLWDESDDVTFNKLNEGFPFDQDFCEVVEKNAGIEPAWRLLKQPLKTLKPSLVVLLRKPPIKTL